MRTASDTSGNPRTRTGASCGTGAPPVEGYAGTCTTGFAPYWPKGKTLLAQGEEPAVTLLETCDEASADIRETFWIAHLANEGAPLTNLTQGGGGIRGWRHSEEAKARIGASQRARPRTAHEKEHLRSINLGREMTPEHKAKIGASLKGRVVSDITRRRCSTTQLGNQNALGCIRTAETRAKMRERAAKGEASPSAALSDDQAQEIRAQYAQGTPQAELARRYNVSKTCVHRVVHGATYATTQPLPDGTLPGALPGTASTSREPPPKTG